MVSGVRGAFSRFFAGEGLFLAAGLAFSFLVCLIPLTLIGVATVGFVVSSERAAAEIVGQLTRNVPVYRRELAGPLLRIVETRELSGVLGTVTLVLFAMPLFGAARLVIHRMMGLKSGHSYVRNLARDAGMVLLLGPLLLMATVVTWVMQWFQGMVVAVAELPPVWGHVMTTGLSLGLSVTMFYLAYRYLPDRRLRIGGALAGAILAAVLWEAAKQLFRVYIRNFGVYDQIYGPLGVLVAFVMFVYYTAIVFVFGAAYAAALDNKSRR
jgi:membrane protein